MISEEFIRLDLVRILILIVHFTIEHSGNLGNR